MSPAPMNWERTVELAGARRARTPVEGTWGVWDLHLRSWLDHGHPDQREAWRALIGMSSDHPWELRIATAGEDGQPILPKVDGKIPCDRCGGGGDCPTCHTPGECPDCDGRGKVAG